MRLSILIPAFNEEAQLPGCLESVREALVACGESAEVVVCDNASTDDTARLAREGGAKVVAEPQRRISRSRNAAAAAAAGDWFLFIDADSRLSPKTLRLMLDAARGGRVVGGGSTIDLRPRPWWGACMVWSWRVVSLCLGWAAGSFVFCRADAFRAVGGFPTEMAAGEEVGLSLALKRWGRERGLAFVILSGAPHVSSGRKFYLYQPREFLAILLEMAMSPRRSLRDTDINRQLYDGRR